MPTIYFRTDGNTQIGLGHITRCLALADMLKENFEILFLVQNPTEIIKKQIKEITDSIIVLPEIIDYIGEAYFIAKNYLQTNQIVVLDGYHFQTEYQKIIKGAGVKLICIDDLHAWHFVADAVINHAGGLRKEEYSCEPYTKLYLGIEYALLRKPFLEAAKKERKIDRIEKVLICFGGSDIHNLSRKAAEACLEIADFKEIHIVLGAAYPFLEEMTTFAKEYSKIHLHKNLNAEEMCNLMQHCELAIAPASGVAYECLAVEMYLITGYYAENQKDIYDFLVNNQLVFEVGDFQIFAKNSLKSPIKALLNNFIKRQEKEKKLSLSYRISKNINIMFHELFISIRKAKQEDVNTYFEWANETEVRKNSLNSAHILWENHIDWFDKKLKDDNAYFYFFEYEQEPLGQVRFEIKDNIALINYSIDKKYRGKGLGKTILLKAMNELKLNLPNISFEAYVKKSNTASILVFQNLNFELLEEQNEILRFTLR